MPAAAPYGQPVHQSTDMTASMLPIDALMDPQAQLKRTLMMHTGADKSIVAKDKDKESDGSDGSTSA